MAPGRGPARADRARLAGERAKSAGQRALDLKSRLTALAEGEHATTWTLDSARSAQVESVRHAEQARQSASAAYTRAADAHRSAAELARFIGDVERAKTHLDLAAADDARAAGAGLG